MGAPTRTLFVLRYVENMELGELALATGCSLSTIKRRLARADKQFSAMACREPALDAYLRSDP
jgi:RNA polymerase sigma-70 factor (ECF subfamily)